MDSYPCHELAEPNNSTPSCDEQLPACDDQLPATAAAPPPLTHGTRQRQYMGTLYANSRPAPPQLVNAATLRLPPPGAADFRVPPLRCSFPSLLHPQYELVKEQCDGWILDVAQPESERGRRLLHDCLLPRLLCRSIPTAASLLRLVHVTKMIAWLMISDDDDDLPDALGTDDIGTEQSGALVMAILRSQEADYAMSTTPAGAAASNTAARTIPHQFEVESARRPRPASESKARALQALGELWGEMRTEMAANLRERFIADMARYFEAVRVQAMYRRGNRIPDMEAYKEIRRQASFILPAFTLVEYALVGMEVGEEVYGDAEVEELRMAALDYICMCNDVVSCRVEIGVGDYFNMPSILYFNNNNSTGTAASGGGGGEGGGGGGGAGALTFQEAIDHVASMIEELDARIVGMSASIHQSLQHANCVSTYLAALGSCMSGCLAWFLETARYRTPISA